MLLNTQIIFNILRYFIKREVKHILYGKSLQMEMERKETRGEKLNNDGKKLKK